MINQSLKNDQVSINDLPKIENLQLTGLHKDHLMAILIGSGIFWLILLGVLLVIYSIGVIPWPILYQRLIIGSVIMIIILRAIWIVKAFYRCKYALRQHDIYYQRGLFWRSFTVLPFNRIQHSEVYQGPIQRLFDLGILRVFTAGGSSSDLNIAGLHINEAKRIKEFILKKAANILEEE